MTQHYIDNANGFVLQYKYVENSRCIDYDGRPAKNIRSLGSGEENTSESSFAFPYLLAGYGGCIP